MTGQKDFYKNLLYSTEFSKYVLEHPEIESKIPEGAQIFFLVDSDPRLTRKNLQTAKQQKKEGHSVILVHVKGLRAETSRLIEPQVEKIAV